MKDVGIRLVLAAMFGLSFYSIAQSFWGEEKSHQRLVSAASQVEDSSKAQIVAASGLDLRAVGALLEKAKDPEDFEKLLNSREEGVNNLDLNGNGKVSYIHVTEFRDKEARGLSLTVSPKPGEVQEVATILLQPEGEGKFQSELRGHPDVYGPGHYYHSPSMGLGSGLLMGYLFSQAMRPPYVSPYNYGQAPVGHQRSPVSSREYATRHNRKGGAGNAYSRKTVGQLGHNVSPNASKSSPSLKRKLSSRKASQKAFKVRKPANSRTLKKRGFGRKKSMPRRTFPRRRVGFGRRR